MKIKHTKAAILAASLISLGTLAGGANAAITLSDVSATSNTITFTIAGTIDGPAPAANTNFLFLSSSIDGASFLSAQDFAPGTSGSGLIGGSAITLFFIENSSGNDRLSFGTISPFSAGDSVSGTFTITTASNIIDPAALLDDGVSLHWGRVTSDASVGASTHTGTFQGAFNVPEPSSALLLGLSAFGLTVARRRRIG